MTARVDCPGDPSARAIPKGVSKAADERNGPLKRSCKTTLGDWSDKHLELSRPGLPDDLHSCLGRKPRHSGLRTRTDQPPILLGNERGAAVAPTDRTKLFSLARVGAHDLSRKRQFAKCARWHRPRYRSVCSESAEVAPPTRFRARIPPIKGNNTPSDSPQMREH